MNVKKKQFFEVKKVWKVITEGAKFIFDQCKMSIKIDIGDSLKILTQSLKRSMWRLQNNGITCSN